MPDMGPARGRTTGLDARGYTVAVRTSAGNMGPTLGVFTASAALFGLSLPHFIAAPTDVSAWRMTLGDLPYLDFWTMYAPGSFGVLALLFDWIGREMLVSRVAGLLTAALATSLYFALAVRVGGRRSAFVATAIVALTFFATGYHARFGSYPPAVALLCAAILLLTPPAHPDGRAAPSLDPRRRVWRVAFAGLLGGAAVVFKHDIAAYALIAMGVATLLAGGVPVAARVRAAGILTAVSLAVTGAAVAWMVEVGAGPAAFDALVRFPLTDFRHVRPEYFPLVPHFTGDAVHDVREATRWVTCHLPTLALVMGAGALARLPRAAPLPLAWWWALSAYPLFWSAAHVQLNTHAITLAALGGLAGAAGLGRWLEDAEARAADTRGGSRRILTIAWAGALVWTSVVMIEPGYRLVERWSGHPVPLDLPHLSGIREPERDRAWMRDLAAAMASMAPPDAPLLVVGARNDTLIFADLTPYWLSDRRPASRHHELHPAITDTERGQREILAAVARGPLPVVVREHRFGDHAVAGAKKRFQDAGVPVGATMLDQWVAGNYRSAGRFGRYELMAPRVLRGDADDQWSSPTSGSRPRRNLVQLLDWCPG